VIGPSSLPPGSLIRAPVCDVYGSMARQAGPGPLMLISTSRRPPPESGPCRYAAPLAENPGSYINSILARTTSWRTGRCAAGRDNRPARDRHAAAAVDPGSEVRAVTARILPDDVQLRKTDDSGGEEHRSGRRVPSGGTDGSGAVSTSIRSTSHNATLVRFATQS
jgi:hypothetical protein